MLKLYVHALHFYLQVNAVVHMSNASMSMRSYKKISTGSPLMEFSNDSGLDGDSGDGGGIAIFSALPLQYFRMNSSA